MSAAQSAASVPQPAEVLVIGAGPAGLAAALTLARLGINVCLAERDGHLGGQVMRLDKLYPTDHCGFCPVWTESAAVRAHPLIRVLGDCSVSEIKAADGGIAAILRQGQAGIDPGLCVFCGRCREACAQRGVPGAIAPREPSVALDPGAAPVMRLDPSLCNGCGACTGVCPTGALDPKRELKTLILPFADVVFAAGFTEARPAVAPEFGYGSHPCVLTALTFERLSAEAGPDGGKLARPGSGEPPRAVAFIQCAGSRDQRYLPYCSGVCCMHALKQAAWIRRRHPLVPCVIFFTDLRAVGKGYEAYASQAKALGVTLVRARPGLVIPAPAEAGQADAAPILIRYEDTASGTVATAAFDMVVLNGGLTACPLPGGESGTLDPSRACGFCQEPADVAQSMIQGGRAAAFVAARLVGDRGGQP